MKKKPIKIIKKKERLAGPEAAALSPKNEDEVNQDPADMARAVSGWVRDFKNKTTAMQSLPTAPRKRSRRRRAA